MKRINAIVPHARAMQVVDALIDAGFRHLSFRPVSGIDVSGSRNSEGDAEPEHVLSQVQLSLVCKNSETDTATAIIRHFGRNGSRISGWVYVSALEQVLPIDDNTAS